MKAIYSVVISCSTIIIKPMVLPICKAEISTWVNAKLRTDSFVRGNIIRILFLFKDCIVGQSVLTLNSTHFIQYFPCSVVNMELIECSNLFTKIKTGREKHFV